MADRRPGPTAAVAHAVDQSLRTVGDGPTRSDDLPGVSRRRAAQPRATDPRNSHLDSRRTTAGRSVAHAGHVDHRYGAARCDDGARATDEMLLTIEKVLLLKGVP